MKKVIIVSGYFNPIHAGHVNYFKEAKALGDVLVVIVNNDRQVEIKQSVPFMPEADRIKIIESIKYVDEVFLSVDNDSSVCESLKKIAEKYKGSELFFANGGDRHKGNIPETEVLKEFNIKTADGVGGGKIQSSSWLLKRAVELQKENEKRI